MNDGDPSTQDPTRLAGMVAQMVNAAMERFRQEQTLQKPESSNAGREQNLDGDMRGNSQFSRVTKIEFPKFGGEDVRGWLFKCEQFFKVDNIAENNKVNLVSIHLFDLALMWHRQFVRFVGEDVGWTVYRNAILKRFDMLYDDPLGELKKLKQTTNMQEYIDAFDRLLCRIGLDEAQCISFFLVGLNSEIELAVRMFKPRTMAEVYELCKLKEAKMNVVNQKSRAPILPTPSAQVYSLEILGDTETELMDDQLEEDVLEIEEVIEYSPHISLNAINAINDRLSQKVSTLQAQVTGEERIKAAFEEFKKYEDDRVNSRCAEIDARLDALSIDFDEELYPHMLTAIVGRQWIIRYGLRLVVMKCAESLKLRHVFADVVFAGIAKGMSEGLKHGVEHGKAKLDLETIKVYDPKADTKYVTALHALKDLKYPLVDQLEKLKDAPIDLIMASLYLESNSREDTPQWICELRPISSQLKIPVYPEVRDPKDPWSFKEEILLEDAIAANISHTEKKKKCWVTDAATQTKISKDEASSRLLRSKSLPPMYNLDWP
ncbi:gypsy type transposase [Tanacetum coccineum]